MSLLVRCEYRMPHEWVRRVLPLRAGRVLVRAPRDLDAALQEIRRHWIDSVPRTPRSLAFVKVRWPVIDVNLNDRKSANARGRA